MEALATAMDRTLLQGIGCQTYGVSCPYIFTLINRRRTIATDRLHLWKALNFDLVPVTKLANQPSL